MADTLFPVGATGAALAFFRVAGLVLIAPIFGSRTVPMRVRGAFSILLVLVLLPVIAQYPAPRIVGPGMIIVEVMVGFGLGFGVAVLLAAAEFAGDVLSVQTGLSGATTLDPLTGQGTAAMGQFLQLVALVLLLVTGGHLVMIGALAESFAIVPVGGLMNVPDGALALVGIGGQLFAQGLRFAAPVIAAVSVGYIALGVLARAAPQLNMLAVAFPLQIGIGLFILAGILPLAVTFYGPWPEHVSGISAHFLGMLGGR